MDELTMDTPGNAWTTVAAITDACYGGTSLFWTDTPSLFNFGVYYDGLNSMGGLRESRHALTYDDAGGLKYLYKTNTYAWETLDLAGQSTRSEPHVSSRRYFIVEDAQYAPSHVARLYGSGTGIWPRLVQLLLRAF